MEDLKNLKKQLYKNHYSSIYTALASKFYDDELRSDAIAQVYVELYERLDGMSLPKRQQFLARTRQDIAGYLYRAAYYKAITLSEQVRKAKSVHQQYYNEYARGAIRMKELGYSDEFLRLKNALSKKNYRILELIAKGYSHKEVAREMGIPSANFRMTLLRARVKAKKILKKLGHYVT